MSDVPAEVLAQHVPEIKLHRAWREYRADCSCGRVGSYVATKSQAAQGPRASRARIGRTGAEPCARAGS